MVLWIVPAVLGFAPINLVRNAEHADCAANRNGLENTRTTVTNRVVQFLMWNMNFHAEHHLYPAVPFFNLPELHVHLKDHLKHVDAGFLEKNRLMVTEWIPKQAAGEKRDDE